MEHKSLEKGTQVTMVPWNGEAGLWRRGIVWVLLASQKPGRGTSWRYEWYCLTGVITLRDTQANSGSSKEPKQHQKVQLKWRHSDTNDRNLHGGEGDRNGEKKSWTLFKKKKVDKEQKAGFL